MMNHGAIALRCCEKLSQQMKNISKETEEKKAEQKELQSKVEATRLKANQLRYAPFSLDLRLRVADSELRAAAYCSASREIEAVRQSYREQWKRLPDPNQVLKEIDFEQKKLIHLEIEIEQIRLNGKTGDLAERQERIATLMNQFATKFGKLKGCLDKLEMMMNRYKITLNEVTADCSQARTVLIELQTRFESRQTRDENYKAWQRALTTDLLVKEHMRRREASDSQNENPQEDDADEDTMKERLINERETNKQLESLVVYMQNWLLQEENFEREMAMLEAME